jgi:uncharacterized protein YecE (DUF72 family)
LQPLDVEKKLVPVLFQLPPYLKCDVALLKDFLAGLPRSLRSAFEFRHVSWFTGEVYEAMRGANVALCQAESEKLETPDVQTADFVYLRLRKEITQQSAQRGHDKSGRARQGDIFVYFKRHARRRAHAESIEVSGRAREPAAQGETEQ